MGTILFLLTIMMKFTPETPRQSDSSSSNAILSVAFPSLFGTICGIGKNSVKAIWGIGKAGVNICHKVYNPSKGEYTAAFAAAVIFFVLQNKMKNGTLDISKLPIDVQKFLLKILTSKN